MKNKFLLPAMMAMAICALLCSCKPNSQKLIVGKWYCDDSHCEIQWLEFKPDGTLIDADGYAYEYKISDEDLIVSNNAGSRALKIVEITKQNLVLQRENIIMRFGKEFDEDDVEVVSEETVDSISEEYYDG